MALFVSTFQLAFLTKKLKSKKQKQTAKSKISFWNVEK
jgi:hypothetical protein